MKKWVHWRCWAYREIFGSNITFLLSWKTRRKKQDLVSCFLFFENKKQDKTRTRRASNFDKILFFENQKFHAHFLIFGVKFDKIRNFLPKKQDLVLVSCFFSTKSEIFCQKNKILFFVSCFWKTRNKTKQEQDDHPWKLDKTKQEQDGGSSCFPA